MKHIIDDGSMYTIIYYANNQTHCFNMNYVCMQSHLSDTRINVTHVFKEDACLLDKYNYSQKR